MYSQKLSNCKYILHYEFKYHGVSIRQTTDDISYFEMHWNTFKDFMDEK